jgi:hypothetical protein
LKEKRTVTTTIDRSKITRKDLGDLVDKAIEVAISEGRSIARIMYDTGSNVGKYSFQNQSCIIVRTVIASDPRDYKDFKVWIPKKKKPCRYKSK